MSGGGSKSLTLETVNVRQDAHEERMDGFDRKLDRIGTDQEAGFRNVLDKMEAKDALSRAERSSMHRDNLETARSKQGNLVAWAAILVLVISLVVGWAITSMSTQTNHERELREVNEKHSAEVRELLWHDINGRDQANRTDLDRVIAETGAMRQKFEEIETQFYWQGDVEAGERADAARLLQLLWKKVYAEDLPAKSPYQRGPQKHSTGAGAFMP